MKRIIAFILAAVILAAVLPVFAAAEKTSDSGITEYYSLPIIDKKLWKPVAGVKNISQRSNSRAEIVYASIEEGAKKASFRATFSSMDLSAYSELALEISVRGEGDSYPFSVTLASEESSYSYSFTSSVNSPVFYMPLERDISEALQSITISVNGEKSHISYVMIGSAIADNTYTYSYTDIFSSTDVISPNKTEKSREGITVYPEDASAVITPSFTHIPFEGNTALVWIEPDKSAGGSLFARATYTDKDGNSSEHVTAAVAVNTAGAYSFTVPGGFTQVSFEFTALTGNEPITVIAGGCADMGKAEATAGSITSCQYDGKKISVSGNLSTDASLKYLGSKLLLFRIPANEAADFDPAKEKPIAQSGFTTKFTLSHDCDKTYARYLYKVVLDTSEGFLPVGSLCAPDCKATAKNPQGSVACLYGAEAADVFESTVSSVILDVYAGKLFENEDIYSAESYSFGSTYHFNKDYLSRIDKDVRFFTSAGVNVYLRIYSDKEGYSFDYTANDPENLALMCAVSTFLSERYASVAGFIAGTPFNTTGADTPDVAEERARLIAAFAESIKSKSPDTAVLIPFSKNEKADSRLAVSMIFYYLSLYRAPSVSLMLDSTEGHSSLSERLNGLLSVASQMGAAVEGGGILWRIPSSYDAKAAVDGYRNLCQEAASSNLRFAAADLSITDRSQTLYDSMKLMLDSENVISTSLSQYDAALAIGDFKGSYPIWDFTSSYDTAGWVGGGSFSDPISDRGTFGGRALSASLKKGETGAGILIARTDAPVNMTGSAARISFCVNSEKAKNAEVSVIFGCGDSRAEFVTTVDCNKESSLLCDMSAFGGAERIDYAALILRGIDEGKAEISKIELCSNTLTNEEMESLLSTDTPKQANPVLYAVIIFLAAATVAVFSILLKKQKTKTGGKKR